MNRSTAVIPASLALAVLLGGCASGPSSPPHGTDPIEMTLFYPPLLLDSYRPGDAQAQESLAVRIFDVTANPFMRTAKILSAGTEPVAADTSSLDVPERGTAFLNRSFDLAVDEGGSDFRVYVEASTGIRRAGSRTVTALGAGESRSVDIYLTPADPPAPGEFGLQIIETWAEQGDTEHLVPLVLVNADSVGGFQVDFSLSSPAIEEVNGFVVDGDSRLYLDESASSITELAGNEVEEGSAWRIIVFSGVGAPAVEPGYSVVLFLSVDIAGDAVSDTLRLSGPVISDDGGNTVTASNVQVLSAPIHIGEGAP